jgi:starch synthase (maltosyl-transferring)
MQTKERKASKEMEIMPRRDGADSENETERNGQMPDRMTRSRAIIEGVTPEVDAGRFPIKRVVGDTVTVEADIFTDGHEAVSAALLYKKEGESGWREVPMTFLTNDRWRAEFPVREVGRYRYTLRAWLDHFKHWSSDLVKRLEAQQDVSVDMVIGADFIEAAASETAGDVRAQLQGYAAKVRNGSREGIEAALSSELAALMAQYAPREPLTEYARELEVVVDPRRALYSTWYEMFPRSCWRPDCDHGTFKDCEDRLTYIASLGFDVLYLPPIHPIGKTKRKGKNNSVEAQEGEVGSPWAIGSEEGGHKSIHPQLGTLEDFRRLVTRAREEFGIEVALDIAFQCSPDHPYVREHPEWFRKRPDGTIQYAENPPKKYQDIYPFDFETPHWREMWEELRSVILYWIDQGVNIFRVDNPHTKSLPFWEWAITTVKERHPQAIFLSEAFTRPKLMYYLAKVGFTQSYNYFPWRNTKYELTEWFTELDETGVREFYRPNLWPNTPDILTEVFQHGGRPVFITRFVLAATLGASYGIYGPAYELGVNEPIGYGKEEYLDSEKYEIKHWNVSQPHSLGNLIARVNGIRRENPALQRDDNIRFHPTSNEQLIAYSKSTDNLDNIVLIVVNLDPHHAQSGFVELPLEEFEIDPHQPYTVHDLITDASFHWSGRRNYVELSPTRMPAHIFSLRRRVRTERDFDYYL